MIYVPKQIPKIDPHEVLRFAGAKMADEALLQQAENAIVRIQSAAVWRLIYQHLPITQMCDTSVTLGDGFVLIGTLPVKYLSDCKGAYILIGTVGQGVDRTIAACGVRSLSQGLFADASGSAAVEALLDDFCQHIAKESQPKPRISPGYGDFPLENQLSVFKLLDASKLLGVCLNDSLLISPSKTVSAIVGTRKVTSCLI